MVHYGIVVVVDNVEVEYRNSGDKERTGISVEFDFFGGRAAADSRKHRTESAQRAGNVLAPDYIPPQRPPGAGVAIQIGDELFHFCTMGANVRIRAVETLFLGRPQCEAQRATRRQGQRRKRSCRVQHLGGAATVVLRAGAKIPGIQMCADHHYLVGSLATGYLCDHAVDGDRATDDRVQVQFNLDGAFGRLAQ